MYRIIHADSGKCYVGSAEDLYKRGHNHASQLRHGRHFNAHLQSAWRLYGAAAFTFEVLELSPREGLREREQFHIDRLTAHDRAVGYNLSPTSVRIVLNEEQRAKMATMKPGRAKTEEHRRKIAETLRGRKIGPFSAEHRQRMSDAMKGKPKSAEHRRKVALARARQDPASLSHPHTQETIERLRALAKARPVSEGVGAKISAALTGRKRGPHTEEAKAKIGAKAKARGPHSEAHRKALSEGQKRRGARGPHTEERKRNISLAKKAAFAARCAAQAGAP